FAASFCGTRTSWDDHSVPGLRERSRCCGPRENTVGCRTCSAGLFVAPKIWGQCATRVGHDQAIDGSAARTDSTWSACAVRSPGRVAREHTVAAIRQADHHGDCGGQGIALGTARLTNGGVTGAVPAHISMSMFARTCHWRWCNVRALPLADTELEL